MGITMLKMDRAKAKWRVKLQHAFNGERKQSVYLRVVEDAYCSQFIDA